MPPSARKPAAKKPDAAVVEEPAEAKPAVDGDICRRCWPNGWRTDTTTNASCEHGTWKR